MDRFFLVFQISKNNGQKYLMRLNANKCKIIHFSEKDGEPSPVIKIGQTTLEAVHSYEYLGISGAATARYA